MSGTLGDPVLLTTYGLPSSSRKGKGKEVASYEPPFVLGSFSGVPNKDEEQVALAVQGDGVHVYELGDLHPVSSRTFGPSTSFASAPAVVISTEDERSTRRTYVALHYAQELKRENADRVIWSWSEPISGGASSSNDRNSVQLEHDITFLVGSSELGSIVAVSRMGGLTQMDLNLNVQNTWSPRDTAPIKKLFSFLARDCKFLPPPVTPNGLTIVSFSERNKELFLQIIIFGPEGEISTLDPLSVTLEGINDAVDISLEPSGNMSILGSDGTWAPFVLDLNGSSIVVSRGSSLLRLRSLSFISQQVTISPSVSILGLHSSFVLLAGTTTKDIVLLLWDIQYGVLLHSSSLPIPSTLDPSGISVQLSKGASSQVLLVLSPAVPRRNSPLRSSVLLVPYSVPERSTIADAMGKADQGAQWLDSSTSQTTQEQGEDTLGREALLAKLREAIENDRIKEADDIFFKWVDERDEKAKTSKADTTGEANESEPQDIEMADEGEQKSGAAKKPPPLKSILDHSLVTQILATVLRPGESSSKHYSPKICQYLVSKHLVSHSMVKGGLLDALFQRNDWETIRECFSYVVDLPENELLRLLHVVTKHNISPSPADPADKDTITPAKSRVPKHWRGVPSISSFLSRVVDYPATQSAWRTALRKQFSGADDLMSLLAVADEWLDVFATNYLPISFREATFNERGVSDPRQVKATKPLKTKGVQLPTLEKLLAFVQAILDSSFLDLLQNSGSHPLLRSIGEKVTLIQSGIMDLQSLYGPLEPFTRAQRRTVTEAAGGRKKREEVDWRKRRKQAHEQAALNLGPYQVEELVF